MTPSIITSSKCNLVTVAYEIQASIYLVITAASVISDKTHVAYPFFIPFCITGL